MPKLKELYTTFKDKGFVIIGIHTTDEAESMADFVKKQQIDYPVVVDQEGEKTGNAYGVTGYPTMILIDPSGKVVKTYEEHPSKEEIEKLLAKAAEKKADEKKAEDKKPAEEKKPAEDKKK